MLAESRGDLGRVAGGGDVAVAGLEGGLARSTPMPRGAPVMNQTLVMMMPLSVPAGPPGGALFSEMFEDSRQPVNAARFVFLDARAQTFYRDWESNTRQIVALLRVEAGRSPFDRSSAIMWANSQPQRPFPEALGSPRCP